MLRVSSRQRLVSWDAFEASATTTDDLDDSVNYDHIQHIAEEVDRSLPFLLPSNFGILNRPEGSWEYCKQDEAPFVSTSIPPQSVGTRKRERECNIKTNLSTNRQPTAITSSCRQDIRSMIEPATLSTPVLSFDDDEVSTIQFEDLLEDVQLHIFSFLDVDSVRGMMATNSKCRRFLMRDDAHSLWLEFCHRKWHDVAETTLSATTMMTKMNDKINLPTAAGKFQDHSCNLPLLLSMTPDQIPTCVDKRLVNGYGSYRRWRRSSLSQLNLLPDKESNNVNGVSLPLVRFTGQVGTGDRCIRANAPFPRPIRRLDGSWSALARIEAAAQKHPSLLDLLCRGAKAVVGRSMSTWRPFVAPYIENDNTLQVSPRMVAYYEVSILETNDNPDESDDEQRPISTTTFQRSRRHVNDCVAIGLATQSFHLHSRMPGWDCLSFGYHGDDGGIFHASGGMVKRFGPSFGAGDTVGCGIDYVTQGIFFTLNGNFLGYGWTGVDLEFLQNDLYPVVGIDTNCAIRCNFGLHPFSFDLTSFHMKYQDVVRESYTWMSNTTTSESKNTLLSNRRRRDNQIKN